MIRKFKVIPETKSITKQFTKQFESMLNRLAKEDDNFIIKESNNTVDIWSIPLSFSCSFRYGDMTIYENEKRIV